MGRIASAGFIVTGLANGIEHCAHLDPLGLLYVSGLLLGLLGTAAFGVLLVRSRALAAWVGWAISVGVLGFMGFAQEGGAFLIGIALVAVGFHLMTIRPTPSTS